MIIGDMIAYNLMINGLDTQKCDFLRKTTL